MKKFALLGQNIEYSLSPKIHNMIYAHMGVEAKYDLMSVTPIQFNGALKKILKLDGFNVTQPYKNKIAGCIELDESAAPLGSVNTVVKKDGKHIGYNTDFSGFKWQFNKLINPKGLKTLVLGAGGVADAIIPALVESGAHVYICNRTLEKAQAAADKSGAFVAHDKSSSYDIVINATSVGLKEGDNAAEGLDFSNTILAFDAIYFKTGFLKEAEANGVPYVIDGLGMLAAQAVFAEELFFDTVIADKDVLINKIINSLRAEI